MPMIPPEKFRHYETKEARNSLARTLGLPDEPYMQDWSIEVADPSRIGEFLEHYECGNLTKDEKYTLMSLAVASFEDKERPDFDSKQWKTIERLLRQDWRIHVFTVWYWSGWGCSSQKLPFKVSRVMRQIWRWFENKLSDGQSI